MIKNASLIKPTLFKGLEMVPLNSRKYKAVNQMKIFTEVTIGKGLKVYLV
jgi:hypothetical protein